MYRVLVATLLAAVAVVVTGCTGSLRLGSSVHVVEGQHQASATANV
jgi:hypothetical protein